MVLVSAVRLLGVRIALRGHDGFLGAWWRRSLACGGWSRGGSRVTVAACLWARLIAALSGEAALLDLLVEALSLLPEASALLGDRGVLPRCSLVASMPPDSEFWSLNSASGGVRWQILLLLCSYRYVFASKVGRS